MPIGLSVFAYWNCSPSLNYSVSFVPRGGREGTLGVLRQEACGHT
jgi:hypothetical protein